MPSDQAAPSDRAAPADQVASASYPQPAAADPPPRSDRVLVSRRVIYLQGVLLAVVGSGAFALGILVARSGVDSGAALSAGRDGLCLVRGCVTYRMRSGRAMPDTGSAVLVLPADARPDEKLPHLGLRPSDAWPPDEHSVWRALHVLGGGYARADRHGRYELELPKTGTYWLLVLSAHSRRGAGKSLPVKDLAELGRYVDSAPDLLGADDYRWARRTISSDVGLTSDAGLDWVFDRPIDESAGPPAFGQ